MKAIINVDPRAALQRGLNNQGDYEIEFAPADLTEAQRNELARRPVQNGAFIANERGDGLAIATADIDALKMILDERIASKLQRDLEHAEAAARELAEAERRAAIWAAEPAENHVVRGLSHYGWRWEVSYPLMHSAVNSRDMTIRVAGTMPAVREAIDDAESLVFWLQLDQAAGEIIERREAEARKEAAEAEKARAAERRTEQLAAWVVEHGTRNQRERLDAGVLPESEIVDAIRAQAFAPLDGEARYKKLKASDVCGGDDYESGYHSVDFDSEDAEELTADEWDYLTALRERMPCAAITVRRHTAECGTCENKITRTGYHVKMCIGELTLSREYGDPYAAE